jgi:hypothetical protein
MSEPGRSFPLAPMSTPIRVLTWVMLALPVALVAAGRGWGALNAAALLVVAIYVWIWLRFRPTSFVVRPDALEVIWPLKRRRMPRAEIAGVRILEGPDLRPELGWCLRVGAGGLWGGFGWLWTGRRGIVQLYVSRTDSFVWIERRGSRPWLITPEDPEGFVRALSS